jgi:UPF0755 protein
MDFETETTTRPRKKRRFGGLVAVLLSVGVLVGVGAVVVNFIGGGVQQIMDRFTVDDYPGPGGPEVEITIPQGASGSDVARLLLEADVVESFDAVYQPMLDLDPTIYPGTYSFPSQIPGLRAVEILIEGDNRVYDQLRLREGLTIDQTIQEIETQLGISSSDILDALSDLESLGIDNPAETADGYLFPATYQFDPGADAEQVVQALLTRLDEELAKHGYTRSDAHELLTMASIIQLEARLEPDFYKVSAVFNNRLELEPPMALQSDATVNYGTGSETVTTTDDQRADSANPYNTYYYPGLPIGPIGNPGGLAIDAAVNPADGDWLYFVTVNLATGETLFNETFAAHDQDVDKFRQYCRDNPGAC